jgi:hypothetical protein
VDEHQLAPAALLGEWHHDQKVHRARSVGRPPNEQGPPEGDP